MYTCLVDYLILSNFVSNKTREDIYLTILHVLNH